MNPLTTGILVLTLLAGWGSAGALTCLNGRQNNNMPASTDGAFSVTGGGATITDSRTGLEWKRCAEGRQWDGSTCVLDTSLSGTYFTWAQAQDLAKNSGFLGGGWRLPNKKELESIVEQSCWQPPIDWAFFPFTSQGNYWTSSSFVPNSSSAWFVDFYFGRDDHRSKGDAVHVRLVRGGQPLDPFEYLAPVPTTVAIVSDTPDPSVVGETVTVAFSVSGGTPTGGVTVTATTGESCMGTLSGGSGSCNLVFNTTGSRDLSAVYGGDSGHAGSTSAAEPHQVNPVPGPTADFIASPNPAACNQSVSFDGSGSAAGHAIRTLVSWEWGFDNDGQYDDASGETVSHTFGNFGNYPVGLRVTDDGGASHSVSRTVDVDQGNRPPIADAGGPYSIAHGDAVTLDGLGSYDPDTGCGDNVMAGAWDVDNDGQYDDATGEMPTIPWSPQLAALGAGTHTIGLRVVDGFGLAGTATTSLTITPWADLAITKTDGLTSAIPGQVLTYTIVASNNGPSDDPSVSVTDTFPANLACTYTSVAAGGASGNTAAGSGNVSETLSMPAGSSVTYMASCTIDAGATGTLSNTASLSGSIPDPTPGNNDATDNDTVLVGVTVTESGGGTEVDESGTTDSFTVVLDSRPATAVVIDVTSADTGEAMVDQASLTFTNADWDQPQTVTVTGVDDVLVDGDQTTTVTLSVNDAGSDDAFDPLADQAVDVVTTDDDDAGFTVTESGGNTEVGESGSTDSFTVVLDAQPVSDVVIDVTSADTGEATVDQASLTFTNGNWDQAQTVTVSGVDDSAFDGDQTTVVTLSINDAGSDDAFDPLADKTLSVTTVDDEVRTFTGPTATGTGEATLTITGSTCALDPAQTAFVSTDGLVLPPRVGFPHGAVRFRIMGCEPGATAEVRLTWPDALGDAEGWKLDGTADPFAIPGATMVGNTYRYSITDGGALDGDGAVDGNMDDPSAPGVTDLGGPPINEIPTLDEWARWSLVLMLILLGWWMLGLRLRR